MEAQRGARGEVSTYYAGIRTRRPKSKQISGKNTKNACALICKRLKIHMHAFIFSIVFEV